MTDLIPSQQRRSVRRRKAAIEGALRYLNEGLAVLPGVRVGTAEKRIRQSPRPMSTAKSLVKDWRRRQPCLVTKLTPPVDDRAALIRTAFAMELGHSWPART